MNKLQAILLMD